MFIYLLLFVLNATMHAMDNFQLNLHDEDSQLLTAVHLKTKLTRIKKEKRIIQCQYRTIQVMAYTGFMLTSLMALDCQSSGRGTINAHSNSTVIHAAAKQVPENHGIVIENAGQLTIGILGISAVIIADLFGAVRTCLARRQTANNPQA